MLSGVFRRLVMLEMGLRSFSSEKRAFSTFKRVSVSMIAHLYRFIRSVSLVSAALYSLFGAQLPGVPPAAQSASISRGVGSCESFTYAGLTIVSSSSSSLNHDTAIREEGVQGGLALRILCG